MKPLGRVTNIVGLDELIIWSLDQLPVHVDDVHRCCTQMFGIGVMAVKYVTLELLISTIFLLMILL